MSKDTPLIKLLGSDVEVQNLTAHQSLKIVLMHNKKLRAEKEVLELENSKLIKQLENVKLEKTKFKKQSGEKQLSVKYCKNRSELLFTFGAVEVLVMAVYQSTH